MQGPPEPSMTPEEQEAHRSEMAREQAEARSINSVRQGALNARNEAGSALEAAIRAGDIEAAAAAAVRISAMTTVHESASNVKPIPAPGPFSNLIR